MHRGQIVSWGLVLLMAVACGITPPPTPATTVAPTPQIAATPATAPATASSATAVVAGAASPSAAAASPTQVVSPTVIDITPAVHTISAREVVELSGNTYASSDIYRFSAETTLDITWNYTGTAAFALWLVNASENVTDPQYDRLLVDDVTGPHTGSAQAKIIAGDWTVEVEQVEGPWTVEFTPHS
jgi:hypothetical protein